MGSAGPAFCDSILSELWAAGWQGGRVARWAQVEERPAAPLLEGACTVWAAGLAAGARSSEFKFTARK